MRKRELEARLKCALYYAGELAGYDGAHHKDYCIDQMVRALTGCQLITKTAIGANGRKYTYQGQGESAEYHAFLAKAGEWESGIAP